MTGEVCGTDAGTEEEFSNLFDDVVSIEWSMRAGEEWFSEFLGLSME